jgi:2-polyprenyl-3-methyl-5-hydroxy-6-metoxy-1,4-benzoquinol methylase
MADTEYNIVTDPTGFITVEPKPSREELQAFYRDLYYQDDAARPLTYKDHYEPLEVEHFQLLASLSLHAICTARPHWRERPGTLLDIGCGEGFLLEQAHTSHFEVTGIDFSSHAIASFFPHLETRLRTGDAFEILQDMDEKGEQFDVITLNNVLEHVIDPRDLLKLIRRTLRPGGLVQVFIPNDYSPLQMKAKELGHIERDFWYCPPHHLSYFNAENLVIFLENAGYRPLDLYASFPIDLFLFHPGSNYVADSAAGKDAHQARMRLDLLMAEAGLDRFHRACQGLAGVNLGRGITVLAEPVT